MVALTGLCTAVKTTITTRARSPLGTLLALAFVAVTLVFFGLYLVTDGGFFTKLKEQIAAYAAAQSVLQTLHDNLKKFDRPHLLTIYALSIVAGAAAVGLFGSFIRTNQYRFIAGKNVIEKRGLWFYLPLCVLAWAALTAIMMFCDRWAIFTLAHRLLGDALYNRISGTALPALWVTLSGAFSWLLLWVLWRRLRPWLGSSLHVPGFRRHVPFSRIKRMEIQNSGEGSTVLVLVLASGAAWTIQAGRVKRLQRLAAVLSRRLGLERRDFITWS